MEVSVVSLGKVTVISKFFVAPTAIGASMLKVLPARAVGVWLSARVAPPDLTVTLSASHRDFSPAS